MAFGSTTRPPKIFQKRAHADHLRVKGGAHPRSRGVTTEAGRFPSATAAAQHHKITRQAAARKARYNTDGWFYTDG